MKVIVAHNRYQSRNPSGENLIVESEMALLRDAGVEVIPYLEDSDELIDPRPTTVGVALAGPIVSVRGVHRIRGLIKTHRPDVLHIHNVYPLISPWAVRTADAAGVPVVQTVHNYRHTCIAGTHLRNGTPCMDCTDHRLPWPAVRHSCYRQSRSQSALMATGQTMHRSTWPRVRRFLTASPLMKDLLVSTGVPAGRVEWRPTSAEDLGGCPLPKGGGVAFVGRLETAKGIELLLDAWTPAVAHRWGRLTIVGQGPLVDLVRERVRQDPTVVWRGPLDGEGVRETMRRAMLIAIPSLWFEGFPRVAAEAMSLGRPFMTWKGAGFSRVANSGAAWALDSDSAAWTHHLLEITAAELEAAATAARSFYEAHCSPSVSLQQLQNTYEFVTSGATVG